MVVLAAILLVGLWRAKARSEAREAFTLTPVLIGGAPAARQRSFLPCFPYWGLRLGVWCWRIACLLLALAHIPARPLPANRLPAHPVCPQSAASSSCAGCSTSTPHLPCARACSRSTAATSGLGESWQQGSMLCRRTARSGARRCSSHALKPLLSTPLLFPESLKWKVRK